MEKDNIGTFLHCPLSGYLDINQKSGKAEADPRAMIGLARVNWLHSKYRIVGPVRLSHWLPSHDNP